MVQLLQRQIEASLVKRFQNFVFGQLAAAVGVKKTEGVLKLLDGGVSAEPRPELPLGCHGRFVRGFRLIFCCLAVGGVDLLA